MTIVVFFKTHYRFLRAKCKKKKAQKRCLYKDDMKGNVQSVINNQLCK